MATISSIGTASRNYSTIAAWNAAFANGGWEGECYNDTEFSESVTLGGTSVANYEILRTATGQSAFDSTANPLFYDITKGAGWKWTGNYSTGCTIGAFCTVQKLQIKNVGAGNSNTTVNFGSGAASAILDKCLVYQPINGYTYAVWMKGNGAQKILNSVIIATFNGGIQIDYANSVILANNTIVKPSSAGGGGNAIRLTSQNPKITNNAFFGWAAAVSVGGGAPTGTNNATDVAAIGFTSSGSLVSQTYANQFASTTADFRLKTGATLIDAGATDTTDIASIDIFGTARPSGSAWDIGAHEFVAGGTIYNVGITESGTGADTVSSKATLPSAVNDNASAADAPASTAVLPSALAEAPSAVDAPASTAVLPSAVAEAGGASDAPASTAVLPSVVAEAGNAQDTDSSNNNLSAIVESAAAQDTVSSTLVGGAAVSEAGSATDSRSSSALLPAAVVEAGALVDVLAAQVAFMAALVEVGIAVDLPAALAILNSGVIEAGTAVDSPSASAPNVTAAKCNTLSSAPRVRALGSAPRIRLLGGDCC